MSKQKAEQLFLKRFDALIEHVKRTQKADPVVRVSNSDWHWIESMCEESGGAIRYQGVEILIVG